MRVDFNQDEENEGINGPNNVRPNVVIKSMLILTIFATIYCVVQFFVNIFDHGYYCLLGPAGTKMFFMTFLTTVFWIISLIACGVSKIRFGNKYTITTFVLSFICGTLFFISMFTIGAAVK